MVVEDERKLKTLVAWFLLTKLVFSIND